jgi:hypothetical protein
VVGEGEARAEMALSAKNKATIKGYKGKRKKKERATEKATASFQETANAAELAMLNYQNKERGQNKEHEAEAAHLEEEEEREQDKWKVLDHRLGNKRSPELQVDTCDDSDAERVGWYKVAPLLKDGLEAEVRSYILQHCNEGPWLKIINKMDGNSGKKKESNTEKEINKVVGTVKEPDLPAVCRHNMYEEDITYTAEENALFCNEGYYLFGLKCAGCAVGFVANGKQNGYKPTNSTPVYCCVLLEGRNAGIRSTGEVCKHAICSSCWKIGLINSNDQTGRRASKRSRQS